jgi:hypothetical protein
MDTPSLTQRRIFNTWWPLAASWLLMSAETPAMTAIVSRLVNSEINLAAWGGVVFPLALIIESPIIMLLAASTALSKDWPSYRKIWKFMMTSSAILTALHLLVALTPLYDVIVRGVLGVPEEIVEPARIGMIIMTPWTWSIAYRRFHQGVLIRFGHSRKVSVGTAIRLVADLLVLSTGYLIGTIPGIIVAASTVIAGVIAEAVYIGIVVHPVINYQLKPAKLISEPLTNSAFASFYFPLVLTSLLSFLAQPITSAAVSRMPLPVASLAVWPAISGLTFSLRSLGLAYNEVVVALLEEPGSHKLLRRFAVWLGLLTSIVVLLFNITPLSNIWFFRFNAFSPALATLAQQSMWLALPLPALAAAQSWFQGLILHGRKTRAISEAVLIYLVITSMVFLAGIAWGKIPGLYIGIAGLTISSLVQVGWLWLRSRKLTPKT